MLCENLVGTIELGFVVCLGLFYFVDETAAGAVSSCITWFLVNELMIPSFGLMCNVISEF